MPEPGGSVRIAGSASLVAGALSMAASEHVSVKAEAEARSAQVAMEREAMEATPETKRQPLVDTDVTKELTPRRPTRSFAGSQSDPSSSSGRSSPNGSASSGPRGSTRGTGAS